MREGGRESDKASVSAGVVYAVTGERFLREAEHSAASVRHHMPGLSIAVFTDRTDADPALFDIIRRIEQPTHSDFDKQFGFGEFLFERTLFLDSDTIVCAPFPEIFELLSRFDMAGSREIWSGAKEIGPICYDDFNGGVIAFAATAATRRILDRWRVLAMEEFREVGRAFHDQSSFRQATYEVSDLRIYVLPHHYNLRLTTPNLLHVWADPVIIHGRNKRIDDLLKRMRSSHEHRLMVPNMSVFEHMEVIVCDRISARVIEPIMALTRRLGRFMRLLTGWARKGRGIRK